MNTAAMRISVGIAAMGLGIATPAAMAQGGGGYEIISSTIDGGAHLATGGGYELAGSVGQPDTSNLSGGGYTLSSGFWPGAQGQGPLGCATVADCGDADGNGIRDDNCTWWECDADACAGINIIFADVGGPFGACEPDGFCNLFDRNHVLSCFSGTNPCGPVNIDAGGAFGSCNPDGFCNLFDANHALTCFAGTNLCSCPAKPGPATIPVIIDEAVLALETKNTRVRPGQTVKIQVVLSTPLAELQGYQLHLGVSGGRRGSLELMDIAIASGKDYVFSGRQARFEAFNTQTDQMLASLEAGIVPVEAGVALATFTYQASHDAAGAFLIDVLHDEHAGDQTFLVAADNGKIEVLRTEPAIIMVDARGDAP